MKTILVPTDHSAEARNALVYALQMAIQIKAEILLLHVFHQQIPVTESLHLDTHIKELEKQKTKELAHYAADVQQELTKDFAFHFHPYTGPETALPAGCFPTASGCHYLEPLPPAEAIISQPVKSVALFGDPSQKILEATVTYAADIVVIGMRGARAMGRAFLGSVVTEVMLRATVPVLAIPLNGHFNGLSSIVFAIDLRSTPDQNHLSFLQDLSKSFAAKLTLLHLYIENKNQELEAIQGTLQEVDKGLPEVGYTVHFKVSGNILESIEEFAKEQKADILVVAPHKHTYLDIILKKSITGTLSAHITLPLLTLPVQETAFAQARVSSFPETQESF